MLNIFVSISIILLISSSLLMYSVHKPLQNIELKLKLMTHSVVIIFPHTTHTEHTLGYIMFIIENQQISLDLSIKLHSRQREIKTTPSASILCGICNHLYNIDLKTKLKKKPTNKQTQSLYLVQVFMHFKNVLHRSCYFITNFCVFNINFILDKKNNNF